MTPEQNRKKIKYYDADVQLTGDEVNDKKIDYSVSENRKVELKITLDWDFPKG